VGFNFVTEPVKDLFEIDAQDAVFVGSTSPSGSINRVIEGLIQLKDNVMEAGVDFLVINTDGWVEGEEAAAYKTRLVDKICPSAVVGMQRGDELNPIINAFHDVKVMVIESPQLIQPRSREKRKILRELSYKKYLKGAKMLSLSLNWLKVKDSLLGVGGPLHNKRLETLSNLLGTRPTYTEENGDTIFTVLRRSEAITEAQIKDVEEHFRKKVKVIREGDEEDLLVGLKDEEDRFLGIGILHGVDYKRKNLKVYTPVSEKVAILYFGQIKLDKNCREIGLSTAYSNYLL
jgi:polynucleotide 5'-hydroxyl-kinase GRC3/NOL9